MIAISENQNEILRIEKNKQRRIAISTAIPVAFLPLLIWALFYFGAIPNKTSFSSDIQEPVAKVITKSGTGTAFLISPTMLLTARHVVDGMEVGDQVELLFEHSQNQMQVKAKIKYIAPTDIQIVGDQADIEYFLTDVAVLEVSEITDIEPLILGESSIVENLDDVILIGYPNGDYSITKGNINSQKYQGFDLFKLDATSNPGNSGGPCILKDDNTVIGILVGGSAIARQGENIALKIDDVKSILDKVGISY
ncbi:MAG: serine protease [Bacteroidales bacterium]|jgi:S1-C subfamily serine protease|nr:serine protease [Bacteroidales bacterium]